MNNKPVENEEISLKELLQKVKEWYSYLLFKWKLIVLAGILGAGIGLTYTYFKKTIYTATLSFALEDDKGGGGLGGAFGLASTLGFDLGGGGGSIFTGSNLNELFKSRTMISQTLMSPVIIDGKKNSLAEMYIGINGWREKWKNDPELKAIQFLPEKANSSFTRLQDSIMGIMHQNLINTSLSIGQRDKKTSIVSMDIRSTNEMFSFYFCEALAKEVGKFYVNTRSKKARMNMEILQRQTDSIRRELNSAITGVAVANDNTFMLNPALNVKKTPSVRRQVDVQANTALLTELVKQSELAKVTLRKETPLIQVIDRPILPLNKERFGKLKGLILGGGIAVFLTVLFLIFKRIIKEISR